MIEFIEGFATQSGDLLVYLFDRDSGELLGKALTYVSAGCGLAPGQTTETPPRVKKGHVAVRSGDHWQLLEDHRGPVYSTLDGRLIDHQVLGPLPENLTILPRPSVHHRWTDHAWVLDEAAAALATSDQAVTQARGHLASTDWYVIRQLETGEAIPDEVLASRKDAREVISTVREKTHV